MWYWLFIVLFALAGWCDTAGAASVRKVDISRAPEIKELAEHARRIGDEMYPKVRAMLADDSSRLPRRFDIVFKKHLEGNRGQTVGATINLRAEWFAKNPTDLDETLTHEMSHVAQKYPSKAWDYWGEGIADYVCYKLGHTNEWNWPHCSFEYPSKQSGWKLHRAWRTGPDGRILEEYPVP